MADKILPNEIQYLSFEGGGGKGAAYLGPFIAFLHPSFNIFRDRDPKTKFKVINETKIKGIAGASAGAITAALLACKVSLEEIGRMAFDRSTAKFKDLGGDNNFSLADVPDISVSPMELGFTKRIRHINALLAPMQAILSIKPDAPSPTSIDNLLEDYGLAPGKVIRENIDILITNSMRANYNRRPVPGLTFRDHHLLTNIELVLTSVNVSRRQLFYLSHKTTPNLRIADAVRMSISIPGFFKPVHITKAQLEKGKYTDYERAILPGYWIDGGVINNNPIHSFDTTGISDERTKGYTVGTLNKHLLGIRLGKEKREIISNGGETLEVNAFEEPSKVGDFLATVVNVVMDNSSELQFHATLERGRVLDLTTSVDANNALSVLNFSPNPKTLKTVINKCLEETLDYFNIPKQQSPLKMIDALPISSTLKSALRVLAL